MKNISLAVDLDNTLINTDLLYKSSIEVLKNNPLLIFAFPFWLIQGKGYLKDQLAKRCVIDVATLPYNKIVIDYIVKNRKNYHKVVLATASHKSYALKVARYCKSKNNAYTITNKQNLNLFNNDKKQAKFTNIKPLFDDVMASNKDLNLSSNKKAQKLIERFGNKNFDYIGDHMRDLPVWESSNMAILVNASTRVIKNTKHLNRLILSKK